MSLLHDRARKLRISELLEIGKGAVLRVTNSAGATSDVALGQLPQAPVTLAAAKTLTAADSGTTYFLGLAGGFTVTLPTPQAGLNFEFIVSVAPTTAYIITTAGGANVMIGGMSCQEIDTATDHVYDDNADTFNFVANQAAVGDRVEMISDGTSWYFKGSVNLAAGVTTATT